MKKNKYYVGVDIGGTKIAAALATAGGKIIGRAKAATPKNALPKKIVRIIYELLEEMLDKEGLRKKDLAGAGVGIPGLVDSVRGAVIRTPNMRLSGVNFRNKLEEALGLKCALGNDADLGTLGEKWLGAAKKSKDVVGLFIGTGVGGGLVVDDRLVAGSHGVAAEIGHMFLKAKGPQCSCGNAGCLEALVGRRAIERDIRRAVKKGKKTVIMKFLEKKTDPIKSRMLRKALKKHDRLTVAVVRAAAEQLGMGCISIRHILDPEMIVLGGGVMEACGDFILPIVKKTVQRDRLFSHIGGCKIVLSSLGDDAVVLGAIALAKNSSGRPS